jgi:hypothetical protein
VVCRRRRARVGQSISGPGHSLDSRKIDYNWMSVRSSPTTVSSVMVGMRKPEHRVCGLICGDTALGELKSRAGRHAIGSRPSRRQRADPSRHGPQPRALGCLRFRRIKRWTPEQIDILRRWDRRGCRIQTPLGIHPSRQARTADGQGGLPAWATEIDRFIVSRLEREGLSLSPEADKENPY